MVDGESQAEPMGPLILAVPSKGRLQENTTAFFARAGLKLAQGSGSRDYAGRLNGVADVEVRYLSASDIASQLAAGSVHLGITGEDLVRETVPDASVHLEMLTPLGFGHATVVVAVPQAWIDVRAMSDLDEVAAEMRLRHGKRLRVATKYIHLTRKFFADKGVADYRIVESLGATEGAPAAGSAELIVDITTTGATLAANALKILDDGIILRSEANLVASLRAPWGQSQRTAMSTVLRRITAEETARMSRELRFIGNAATMTVLDTASHTQPGALAWHTGDHPGSETIVTCPSDLTFTLSEALVRAGATAVTVRQLDYVFRDENPLIDRLLSRLDPGSSAPPTSQA